MKIMVNPLIKIFRKIKKKLNWRTHDTAMVHANKACLYLPRQIGAVSFHVAPLQ
jgi:hypothetical protein